MAIMRDTVYTEEWLRDYKSRMKQSTRNPTVREPSRVEATSDKVESAPSKYKNIKTEIDGIKFDSKKEAKRYQELRLLEQAGAINELKLQQRVPLEVNGTKVCTYICDFAYWVPRAGLTQHIFEDCKGMRTPVYLLKKKLVKAILGVDILET